MADPGTRRLAVARPAGQQQACVPAGLADIVTMQSRVAARTDDADEMAFFHDTLAEFSWARDVAGVAPQTMPTILAPIVEITRFYECAPWRIGPRDLDRYFAGPGKRKHSTMRRKLTSIDGYFAFLEQRYRGDISRRFGVTVESPVDAFNRPRHRGDFALRIPPSRRAMADFFQAWRTDLRVARKYPVAARDYVMAKIAYLSGVRANELCAVRVGDVHWELGQWGRFVVVGKGARGSGPRERQAYLFAEGRELLWWYVEEVRGEFTDDPSDPTAPMWPSERLPRSVAALNIPVAPPVQPCTFRRTLKAAGELYLPGPVRDLHPHLLRHACATHNYEAGMPLWDVQKLLGHDWPSSTVGYLASTRADPEIAILQSTQRAVRRLSREG